MPEEPPAIDVETLRAWLERGERVTVVDVRPTEERRDWHIPGSRHVDAYASLRAGDDDALDGLDAPRDRPVVLVCAAGNTSKIAARELQRQGYDARSLAGGMRAWSLAWNTARLDLADDVRVLQVRRTGKGCLSYLLVSATEALVIDAALPAEVYEDLAAAHGATIVGVVDTHVHADHLSRGRTLAERTHAPWYVPAQERLECPFTPLRHGDTIPFGDARLETLHTPGHTWESSCYRVAGALFSGDTLFVEGVGRPDLEAATGEAAERAGALHESLQALLDLPGDTLVLPGHTSDPLPFDHEPWTAPLERVAREVALLALDRDAFVQRLTTELPENPPNHARIVALNEACELPDDVVELEAGANRCAVR